MAGYGAGAVAKHPWLRAPWKGSRSAAQVFSFGAVTRDTRELSPVPRAPATASPAKGRSCVLQMLRKRPARGKLASTFAQIREAQDRVGEIVVGRQFQRVDAGFSKRGANVG